MLGIKNTNQKGEKIMKLLNELFKREEINDVEYQILKKELLAETPSLIQRRELEEMIKKVHYKRKKIGTFL